MSQATNEASAALELLYPRIQAAVYGTPWAIVPATLAVIVELLRRRAGGGRLPAEEVAARLAAAGPGRPRQLAAPGIAVLPLYGPLLHHGGLLVESSGATDPRAFAAAFRRAVADPAIGAIVLDVDSPGGSVAGIPETAADVFAARGRKPLVAVANAWAASAAYWIATAADELVVTPSGEVGSIGVLAVHEDISEAEAKRGSRTTVVAAGKYKAEFTPFAPLGDEARAELQRGADHYYGQFTEAVAKQRGVSVREVRAGFGAGRMVTAAEAVRLGMADRVETLEETLARLARRRPGAGGGAGQAGGEPFVGRVTGEGEQPDLVLEPTLPTEAAQDTASVDTDRANPSADLDRRRRRLRLHGRAAAPLDSSPPRPVE